MQVSEVMTANPVSAAADENLRSVATKMAEGNFGSLPVIADGRVAGVVTDRDIAVRGVAAGHGPDQPVSAVMTADPVCIAAHSSVQDAARLMQDRQIRRLYVTDADRLVGVVALGDVAQQADGALSGETLQQISKG